MFGQPLEPHMFVQLIQYSILLMLDGKIIEEHHHRSEDATYQSYCSGVRDLRVTLREVFHDVPLLFGWLPYVLSLL